MKSTTLLLVLVFVSEAGAAPPRYDYQGVIERGPLSVQMVSPRTLQLEELARQKYARFREAGPSCAPRTQAESRYYDSRGNYAGRSSSSTSNGRKESRFYDSHGNNAGREVTYQGRHSGPTQSTFYDAKGNYAGRATSYKPK